MPVIIGALGCVEKEIGTWIKKKIKHVKVGLLQKTTLLGTARILRRVLGTRGKENEIKNHWSGDEACVRGFRREKIYLNKPAEYLRPQY